VRGVLVDAGPLVAILDRSDEEHRACVAALKKLRDPLFTVWPAFTEAMYLLGFAWQAQRALWEMFEARAIQLLDLGHKDAPRMRALMEKYADLPMDLADAALVTVAEREGLDRIFTIDRADFGVYRLSGRKRFVLVPI
jgi:predicted nucleic acid-binding protein